MKPVLHLRLHAMQSQPCFPAASNALVLPSNNLIFAAMPTERTTHYTLQEKSCVKEQAHLETTVLTTSYYFLVIFYTNITTSPYIL